MNKEGKFFNFNIGHLILLVSWIASAAWFSSALDKRITFLELQSKESLIVLNNMKTSLINLDARQNAMDNKVVGSDNRITLLEANNSKISSTIGAIATDISWLKENLTKQQDRLGEALLKVLNDKNNGPRS
jgi:peptidoglycan hydrolase CwlO-like protein